MRKTVGGILFGKYKQSHTVLRILLPKINGIVFNKIWKSFGQQYPCLIFNNSKMKRLFILGAIALLSSTVFSCTADDLVPSDTKTDQKENVSPANVAADQGPGDEPIIVPPPK